MYSSCYWHSSPCDVERDFTEILTDLGLCYQFNSHKRKELLSVKEAGELRILAMLEAPKMTPLLHFIGYLHYYMIFQKSEDQFFNKGSIDVKSTVTFEK